MASAGAITPANVSFSVGGTQTPIVDAKMNIKIDNNCRYTECILPKGVKGDLLKKGAEVTRDGDLKIQTAKTGDDRSKGAIKILEEKHKLTEKHDNPKDYNQDITFSVMTPGGKTFANISFQGFVKEYKEFDPVGTAPPKQEADIELYDPLTLKISN